MKRVTLFILSTLVAIMCHAQATVPDGATVEQWMCSFVMHSNTYSGEQTETVVEEMGVAFSGEDVYFNLPNPIAGNTWVKGSRQGSQVVFPSGQLLGNYGGNVYMVGQNEAGLCDVMFDYDEGRSLFTIADMQLVLSASATAISAWAYYTGMVVAKEGLAIDDPRDHAESWTLTGRNVNPLNQAQYEELNETVKVAFGDYGDIYIQGLAAADATVWISGTINGSTATFARQQSAGTYSGTKLYFIGYAGGTEALDVVFDYDADNGRLVAQSYILNVDGDGNTYVLLQDVVIFRQDSTPIVEEQTVEAPKDLVTEEYVFKGTSLSYNQDGTVAGMKQEQWNVRVGEYNHRTDGKGTDVCDIYIQGLCQLFPNAWVKGTLANDELTIESGQFLGQHPQIKSFMMYFTATEGGLDGLTDMVMFHDTDADVYSGGMYYMLLNSQKATVAPYYVYAGITITKIADVAATPKAPVVEQFEPYDASMGYGYVCLTLPTEDVNGNAILMDRMKYRMYTIAAGGEPQLYTFDNRDYRDLPASTSEIDYMYGDGYDFFLGGSFIALFEDSQQWSRVGFQTVYYGGGESHASAITWYELAPSGIASVRLTSSSSQYFDLQGRPVAQPRKGLYITNGKKVMLK